MISRAESGTAEARETLGAIYRRAGRAHVLGITGVPGSGKSTLTARLVELLRKEGQSVATVAVDPSSPYSGGAILGDRIRMAEHALDPQVFIRSMATRGATGGMAHAALDVVDILDVAGFDTDFAYETALRKQSGEKPVIGVNRYKAEGPGERIEVHPYDPTTAERQISRLHRVHSERDEAKVQALLDELVAVAKDDSRNIMPVTIELVREGATMGDIVEKLKTVWGIYRETPVF